MTRVVGRVANGVELLTNGRYRVRIQIQGRTRYLGTFDTIHEAVGVFREESLQRVPTIRSLPKNKRQISRDHYARHRDEILSWSREYRRAYPDRRKKITDRYRMENKPKIKDTNFRSHLKRKYGLTVEEWSSIAEQQDNKCGICDEVKQLVVDHIKGTKIVRGMLCFHCNVMLGMARDSPSVLRAAATYLERRRNQDDDPAARERKNNAHVAEWHTHQF